MHPTRARLALPFKDKLNEVFFFIRQRCPGEHPAQDLASFLGVTPCIIWEWRTGVISPIRLHYDWLCCAIPCMKDFPPNFSHEDQDKPGPKATVARRSLPSYFVRAVEAYMRNHP